MRIRNRVRFWSLAVIALVVCNVGLGAGLLAARDDDGDDDRGSWGAVFTLTNEASGNRLAVFPRDGQGRIGTPSFYPTGGNGSGGGLGNQGAVALSADSHLLYAVNAGSNSITVFQLGRQGPKALQVIGSGGTRPISLTVSERSLFVLNAGGAAGGVDSIAGFSINEDGRVDPLNKSVMTFGAANVGPAQISFNSEGNVLTVTEKGTNSITLFALNGRGVPTVRKTVPASGRTPFGFAYTSDDLLVVSEAFGGGANASAVSSYDLNTFAGALSVITASAPDHQTAACWIAITADDEYAYTTNTGSGSVSGYRIGGNGKLTILNADGVTGKTGKSPTDAAILGNKLLYILNSRDFTVSTFVIGKGGSLIVGPVTSGLPESQPTGLVVR